MRDLSTLPNLKVALVQTTLAWHDREANYAHFEVLLEQVSRHAVLLERLKAGEVKKFETVLRKVDTQVRDQLTRKELTTYSRSRLEEFLGRVGGKLLEDLYFSTLRVLQGDGAHAPGSGDRQ